MMADNRERIIERALQEFRNTRATIEEIARDLRADASDHLTRMSRELAGDMVDEQDPEDVDDYQAVLEHEAREHQAKLDAASEIGRRNRRARGVPEDE